MYRVEEKWLDGTIDFWMCDTEEEAKEVLEKFSQEESTNPDNVFSYRPATKREITICLASRDRNSLGQDIRFHRLEKGLTQTQLAEKMSVSQCTISDWERNASKPSSTHLKMLLYSILAR